MNFCPWICLDLFVNGRTSVSWNGTWMSSTSSLSVVLRPGRQEKEKRLSTGVRHPGSHPWNCVCKRLKIAGSWFLLTFLLRFMGEASTWTRHGRRHSKQETSGNIRKPGDSAEGDSTICHFVWATWRSWWTTWSCTCECRGRKTIAI